MTYQLMSGWGIQAFAKIHEKADKYRKLVLSEAEDKGHYKCPHNLWDRLHVEFPKLSRADSEQKGLYRETFLAKLERDLQDEINRLTPKYGNKVRRQSNERGLAFRTGYDRFGLPYVYPIYL